MNKNAVPEFAMSFTQEAVVLERRQGHQWQVLGQVRFAAGNMADRLKGLRGDEEGSDSDLDTVLVIPDDQILYTTVTVSPGSDVSAVIGRSLEGMTSYTADELVFDWCADASGRIDSLRVAAVAKITLNEAETFACEQGFRPLGFEGRPGDDRFNGQPDFGPSRIAEERRSSAPFSKPNLRNAGITSDKIELDTPDNAAVVVSRIVPHYFATSQAAGAVSASVPVGVADDLAAPPAEGETASKVAGPVVSGPAVIRHRERRGEAAAGENLSVRAQAFHERAEKARIQRNQREEPEEAAAGGVLARLQDSAPGTLTVMIGILLAALLAGWIMLGGDSQDASAVDESTAAGSQEIAPIDAAPVETDTVDTAPAETVPVETVEETPSAPTEGTDLPQTGATEPNLGETALPTDQVVPAPGTQPGQSGALTAPGAAQNQGLPNAGADSLNPQTAAPQRPPQTAITDPAASTAPTPGSVGADAAANSAAAPGAANAPQSGAVGETAGPQDPLTAALAEALKGTSIEAQSGAGNGAPAAGNSEQAAPAAPSTPAPAASPTPAPAASPSAGAQNTATSTPAPAPTQAAPAPSNTRLQNSTRPPRAAPQPAATPAPSDARPNVPSDPLPYVAPDEARTEPVTGDRPPSRPSSTPQAAPAPAPDEQAAAPDQGGSATGNSTFDRPAPRPGELSFLEEGSAAEPEESRMTLQEKQFLEQLLQDLRTAQAGATTLSEQERGAVIVLAQARPQSRPLAVAEPSAAAVEEALSDAMEASDRPARRSAASASTAAPPPEAPAAQPPAAAAPRAAATASTTPASRPQARPQDRPASSTAGNPSIASGAIDSALAEAVNSAPADPAAAGQTRLTASAMPPRSNRAAAAAAPAAGAAANAAAGSAAVLGAAVPTPETDRETAAAIAAQQKLDDQLQAQAEARARQRAAADAQAEAQARAEAEARARAQAQAEARAAQARNQAYVPPEAEKEPEVTGPIPDGRTRTTAAATATIKDGIQLRQTQIIGTVGAGKASRALVRLSNGRVITLRLGDKINGGQITEIGNSRITYVARGQTRQLGVLNGK